MKRLHALLALILFSIANAQSGDQLFNEDLVDIKPQFRQGTPVFLQLMEKEHDGGKEMINEMAIVVEKNGSVSEMEIIGSNGKFSAKEATRLAKLSPKWIPATKSGIPVRCRFLLSRIARVSFKGEPDSELTIDAVPGMPKSESGDDNTIYNIAGIDERPEFPGGMPRFYKYMKDNFKMSTPETSGRVIVSFIVEKDGSLSEIKLVRNTAAAEYGPEIIRVLKRSPKWKPAAHNKKKVRCSFTLPIAFPISMPDDKIQPIRDKN